MKRLPVAPPRACGECSACCTAVAVREIGKLAGEACPQQLPAGGCAVYASRPGECASYSCMWLQGHGREADRPDRLGVVFSRMTFAPGAPHVVVHAAGGGRLPREADQFLRECVARFLVFRSEGGRLGLLGGPDDAVEWFCRALRRGEISYGP